MFKFRWQKVKNIFHLFNLQPGTYKIYLDTYILYLLLFIDFRAQNTTFLLRGIKLMNLRLGIHIH